MLNNLNATFWQNFIKILTTKEYMLLLLEGLGGTLLITFGAAVIGVLLGTFVAVVKLLPQNKWYAKVLNVICDIYTTIFRGTPMTLQLCIMVLVVFAIRGFPIELIAILSFGINSGAYVSEAIRGGILSVDIGQTEAGRALGLSYTKTLTKIVIPQAIKNVIPAIGNEIIALLKETSIVSMVGEVNDLTKIAKILNGTNYIASYFAPAVVVALFYLAIVYLFTFIVKIIERRLRASDKR